GELRMARANWDTGYFQAAIFEDLLTELGYDVTVVGDLGADVFYQAVSEGEDVDLWANGWLPLHGVFLTDEDVLGRAIPVGFQVRAGALQGYLIDKATADEFGITSIAQMADPEIAALFDTDGDGAANLTGCNDGWGCAVEINENHLPNFELEDAINHVQGDYALLMSETLNRFERGESVFFYTWTPNWTINEMVPGEDVVWLTTPDVEGVEPVEGVAGCTEDPCQMGFIGSDIRAVANVDFLRANPAVAALLSVVEIPLGDIAAQNVLMQEGEDSDDDIQDQAAEWIDDNRDLADEWVAFAMENADNTELVEEFITEWLDTAAAMDMQ
ncbi:MAG: glycine betaine/L-proline ABC transporter substrate-binding protein ProX, partial [Chloroflexi bacterium]|nr:glycine betaine/L-proline ABC transporter substrate-binding protein ProX [Chloroflexota bacterium]